MLFLRKAVVATVFASCAAVWCATLPVDAIAPRGPSARYTDGTTSNTPANWAHTVKVTQTGATLEVNIPRNVRRTTFRITTQSGRQSWSASTTRRGERALVISGKLSADTDYRYTVEADARVVATGSLRTSGGETSGPPRPAAESLSFAADVGQNGLSRFASVHNRQGITVVDDPILGSQRKVLKLTTLDTYDTPTGDPRTQVEAPSNLTSGQEVFIGWSTLFPADFPRGYPDRDGFISLGSVYGPPYAGKGPLGLGVSPRGDLYWERNATYGYDDPWTHSLTRNVWHDFVHRIKLSSDPNVGFVELYLNTGNGWVQQPLNGQSRLYMQTLDASNGTGPNGSALANYRKAGMFDSVTLYHADYRIGSSFAAVAPNSHSSN